eukprot:11389085-Alexandrium_andersonii.AAC.1
MKVFLGEAATLLQREQDFLNGVSPSGGVAQTSGDTHAGLMSDEIMTSAQWVDAVVTEMSDAACMVLERVWNDWRASFKVDRGSLAEQVLHRLGMLRVENWMAKFVEAEARDPVVAAEIEGCLLYTSDAADDM